MTDKELLEIAERARAAAYCPYSNVSVGAALLCEGGEVYTGANIENAAFSPSVCAERVALFSAVHDGKRCFSAIAVVGGRQGEPPSLTFSPCGVCRQVLSEFAEEDLRIILGCGEEISVFSLSELLPFEFGKSNL